MRNIRFLDSAATEIGTFAKGQIVAVPNEYAAAWVRAGIAEYDGEDLPPAQNRETAVKKDKAVKR
jgi:hypothetical protein